MKRLTKLFIATFATYAVSLQAAQAFSFFGSDLDIKEVTSTQRLQGNLSYYEEEKLQNTENLSLEIQLGDVRQNVPQKSQSENNDNRYLVMTVNIKGLPSSFEDFSQLEILAHQATLQYSIENFAKDPTSWNRKDTVSFEGKKDSAVCTFGFKTPKNIQELAQSPKLVSFSCAESYFFRGYFGGAADKYKLTFTP